MFDGVTLHSNFKYVATYHDLNYEEKKKLYKHIQDYLNEKIEIDKVQEKLYQDWGLATLPGNLLSVVSRLQEHIEFGNKKLYTKKDMELVFMELCKFLDIEK